jgi:hypothetical protein
MMSTAPTPGTNAAADQQPQRIGSFDIKELLFVAVAGAAGGILFWLLSAWSSLPTFPGWPLYGQILALAFIGAIAALFGVYLLTASDLTAMRTYVFAIVCGLVWQPIINSARQSVNYASAGRQVSAVNTQADQLSSALNQGNAQRIDTAVTATVPAVTQAIDQLPSVQDAAQKQEIVNGSKKAITALESASAKAPAPSIQAIQKIGVSAGQANQTDVGLSAIQSLHTISMHSSTPSAISASEESIKAIAASSKDPSVKKAAEVSLRDLSSQRAAFKPK